ncbi:MAG: nitroreductase family protein [Oligoflexus sp.]
MKKHADRNYHESPPNFDPKSFVDILRSRRSIRRFSATPIPDAVMRECLELTLLAPNSSNLQAWEFYWVREPENRLALIQACLNQQAARTAAALVVAVARPDTYRRNAKLMLETLNRSGSFSESMLQYYRRLVPILYGVGPGSLFGGVKWLLCSIIGWFRPIIRGPFSRKEREMWAVKTCALGCENLMLALRAHGFDSCPLEGMDEVRIRKILKLPRSARVAMVIAAGERAVGGVYGPQVRLPSSLFLFEV